jgi:hypothetical protein
MIARIATAAAAAVGFALALSAAAGAAASVRLRASDVDFLAGPLAIVAHGSVSIDAANGGHGSADAAYVDLRKNRLVLAGHARFGALAADALAVDLEGGHVDALRVEDGASAGTFDFPDVDPRAVFIRARRATIVPHANVRFTPASFPTSTGAPPVPSYLYTFANNSGFAAQSLPGASFDQPYGLVGSPSSLLAGHLRYVQGTGLDVAVDDHLVDGNRSFLVTSIDAPERTTRLFGLNGYRKLGSRYTAMVDGIANAQTFFFHTAQTAAFGPAGARLDTSVFSGGGGSSDLTLRGPDRPLFLGLTYRVQGDLGVQFQRGGVLAQLPDAANYQSLWHHGLDLFVSTPQIRGPLHTTLNATFDTGETWYAFPHSHGTFSATGTMTRRFGPLTATAIYAQAEDLESFGTLQGVFYPPPSTLYITPDGTPWPGFATFAGASTARLYQLGLQLVTSPSTTYRVTYAHTNDFPQFHGFGRPVDSVALDVRFRLAPNIGLDVGRSYDFAWGGTRWVPSWVLAILP